METIFENPDKASIALEKLSNDLSLINTVDSRLSSTSLVYQLIIGDDAEPTNVTFRKPERCGIYSQLQDEHPEKFIEPYGKKIDSKQRLSERVYKEPVYHSTTVAEESQSYVREDDKPPTLQRYSKLVEYYSDERESTRYSAANYRTSRRYDRHSTDLDPLLMDRSPNLNLRENLFESDNKDNISTPVTRASQPDEKWELYLKHRPSYSEVKTDYENLKSFKMDKKEAEELYKKFTKRNKDSKNNSKLTVKKI